MKKMLGILAAGLFCMGLSAGPLASSAWAQGTKDKGKVEQKCDKNGKPCKKDAPDCKKENCKPKKKTPPKK